MIKIFTMVKDEVDIVYDWIVYHSTIFGNDNIYVIDNYSTDGTYEILQKNILSTNLFREKDYTKKGIYMTKLIHTYAQDMIAFPIDIDEFIVYYNNNNKNIYIDKKLILLYLNNLPKARVYKADFIWSLITNENGYNRATVESNEGMYKSINKLAKSFVNTTYFKGVFDHGNHLKCNDYFLTKICLIHFHSRNLPQMKAKILNNILGLGYKNNIYYLKNLLDNDIFCRGNHHIKNQIEILNNTYKLEISKSNKNNIDLSLFNNYIKECTSLTIFNKNVILNEEQIMDVLTKIKGTLLKVVDNNYNNNNKLIEEKNSQTVNNLT